MITPLTVSAVQYEALDGGVAANLAEHISLIEDAEDHGSRLVIFPELSVTGYALQRLSDPDQWLSPADARLDGIREICRRTGITAVVGAPYREPDGTPRLASLVVHPSGAVEASFKVRLHGGEAEWFAAGEGAAVLELDGWRVALAICFDAARPAQLRKRGSTSTPSPACTSTRGGAGWTSGWALAPWTTGCTASSRTWAAARRSGPPRGRAASGARTASLSGRPKGRAPR